MLDTGVESLSNGSHRIHRTRTDSDGKVHVYLWKTSKKVTHVGLGVESRSDGIHRIHWRRTHSNGKSMIMLNEGVESSSDGIHRIHWTQIAMEICIS